MVLLLSVRCLWKIGKKSSLVYLATNVVIYLLPFSRRTEKNIRLDYITSKQPELMPLKTNFKQSLL